MIKANRTSGRESHAEKGTRKGIRGFLALLGPGLVTGAADDDPSGVVTYTIAGAKSGTALLWTALLTWPLMAAVQMMCARIGMVTGQGLAGALRHRFPRSLVLVVSLILLIANIINIGADLAGMADAAILLTGGNFHVFVLFFGAVIGVLAIRFRYRQIANCLKWLCLVLVAYMIVAFLAVSDWWQVLRDTLVPSWPSDHAAWANLVAILGTTISPYLFFWQAAQEVEEEKAAGRRMAIRKSNRTAEDIKNRRIDVAVGTLASNLVMFFIIVTSANTLHRHGNTNVETSRQAAEALTPLAGNFAATLYTLGILGTGFLAIPTLAGSAAYAFAETLRWRQGLEEKFNRAKLFYGVIILALLCGVLLNFLHINPIKALLWSAVLNGLLAPFLLIGLLMIAADKKIMRNQPSPKFLLALGFITALIMFFAAIGMFIF